jgi:hypothetical protein
MLLRDDRPVGPVLAASSKVSPLGGSPVPLPSLLELDDIDEISHRGNCRSRKSFWAEYSSTLTDWRTCYEMVAASDGVLGFRSLGDVSMEAFPCPWMRW